MNAPSSSRENDGRDKEEGNVVTMVDVLEEVNEWEEDANAVLGGVDDKICSYSKGYMFRQPLYACATCNPPENGKPAGICLACSYSCHEGHEMIELYTKRNFRCDCGNTNFPNAKCNLEPIKDEINEKNSYNQNFMGTYCTCKRPYPDPEDPIDDDMIQCVICEDWFHKRHLGVDTSVIPDYDEIICQGCMSDHSFLWKYTGLCVKARESADESVNVSVNESGCEETQECKNEQEADKQAEKVCYLKTSTSEIGTGSTFWPDGWRKHLCDCEECISMYETEKVSFLLSENDTAQYYESKNKEFAKESQYEKGLKALSSLDRIRQVEAIERYNQMKAELMGYLRKFAENKKVVREEDMREFFSQMQARKKHKDSHI